MKLFLKKPALHEDAMYGAESTIDMKDLNRANFMIQMGLAEKVDDAVPVSDRREPPRPLRSAHADQIGEAVAEGIIKATKAIKSDDKQEKSK